MDAAGGEYENLLIRLLGFALLFSGSHGKADFFRSIRPARLGAAGESGRTTMSDAGAKRPQKPDRMAELIAMVARRAVLFGIVAGGLVGLSLGGVVLKIVGCRREAAAEREDQRILREWNAEQERKRRVDGR
jgi:hypothetical protein